MLETAAKVEEEEEDDEEESEKKPEDDGLQVLIDFFLMISFTNHIHVSFIDLLVLRCGDVDEFGSFARGADSSNAQNVHHAGFYRC